MAQRIRDIISAPVTLDYFQSRRGEGWTLAAVEWVRDMDESSERNAVPEVSGSEEIPYGYRVASDCSHLMEEPGEMEAVAIIFEKVVSGWRAPQIAQELNARSYRTRENRPWTAATVFDLLPRLIELSPRLLKRPEWPAKRKTLQVIA